MNCIINWIKSSRITTRASDPMYYLTILLSRCLPVCIAIYQTRAVNRVVNTSGQDDIDGVHGRCRAAPRRANSH